MFEGIENGMPGRQRFWKIHRDGTEDKVVMPVLSKFYGIVIRMLCVRSLDARFHAIYQNCELVVGVWPLKIIQGDAPGWVREKVITWATQHQQELLAAWNCCQYRQRPMVIAPLP